MTDNNILTQRVLPPYFNIDTDRPEPIRDHRRLYRSLAFGVVVSGAIACFASVGVGVGVILIGVVVLAEL